MFNHSTGVTPIILAVIIALVKTMVIKKLWTSSAYSKSIIVDKYNQGSFKDTSINERQSYDCRYQKARKYNNRLIQFTILSIDATRDVKAGGGSFDVRFVLVMDHRRWISVLWCCRFKNELTKGPLGSADKAIDIIQIPLMFAAFMSIKGSEIVIIISMY